MMHGCFVRRYVKDFARSLRFCLDWKWRRLIKESPSRQTWKRDPSTRTHEAPDRGREEGKGRAPDIGAASPYFLNPHLVAQWDGIGETRAGTKKVPGSLPQPSRESATGVAHHRGCDSTLLSRGGRARLAFDVVRTITSLIGYLWGAVEITIQPSRLQNRW